MPQHSGRFRVALNASTTATLASLLIATALFGMTSCAPNHKRDQKNHVASGKTKKGAAATPVDLRPVDLSDAVHPVVKSGGVELALAKNEWASFVIQMGSRPAGATYGVRVVPNVPAAEVRVYQVMPMPVDMNRAGYARHTGQDAGLGTLPRALLPIAPDADGVVELAKFRDASRAADPTAALPSNEPALIWVDVRLPADAVAGDFEGACEAVAGGEAVSFVPLKLHVNDFALPEDRHLQVIGRVNWDDLERLYPDWFQAITPRLINRREDRYQHAVRVMDALMALAHEHRTCAVIPRLQPTAKWPAGAPPEIDWSDFDSLAGPWLTGDAFADKRPQGFWPLPAPDMLTRYNRASQIEWWTRAATHFDQNDWIDRAPLWIEKVTPGRASPEEAAQISKQAAEVMANHQRLRVAVPIETDQFEVAQPAENPGANAGQAADKIDPSTTNRLISAAPGLVFAPPMRIWPDAVQQPAHYLRTDMPALVPYIGAGGDERDVRLWAWLAYLRQAQWISFADALPSLSDPTAPADPNELIWFYPGEWFGLDQPVPTIQLKWLRRAEQDYEYLKLVRDRADAAKDANGRAARLTSLVMARLVTKPVEIQPGQTPDPAYAMMSGTTNQAAWEEAQRLLAEFIVLNTPGGTPPDPQRVGRAEIAALRWAEPQERPLLMGRATEWSLEPGNGKDSWLHLALGLDLYNASDLTQGENLLGWTLAPPGWEVAPQPGPAPALPTYNVRRAGIEARFDLSKLTPAAARAPMEVTFINGHNRDRTASLRLALPVAASDKHEGPLAMDGRIADDWSEADLVQSGRLIKMLSRPNLQRQQLEPASTDSKIYTTWAANNFYVAFDLGGISPTGAAKAQNFVDYQFRRAWSEDLCELLIQPVDNQGIAGPVLHVVCKPNGSSWVERKVAPAAAAVVGNGNAAWQEVEARVFYVARPDGDRWRGEVQIPWRAILTAASGAGEGNDQPVEPPTLLRFNFAQHRNATGESASWAGPVDFGRDDSFMGVLYLRDPQEPGPRGLATGRPRRSAPTDER
jgi:hypothetical protein